MRATIIVLALLAGCRTLAPVAALSERLGANLFEYGCGYFGEHDYEAAIPDLGPPHLKLYEDATLVVRTDDGFEERRISATQLKQLRLRIGRISSEHPKASPERGRRPLLMHGGLCYVRLGSEDQEVIRVFDGIPGGRTGRLLAGLEQAESTTVRRFVPENVVVELEPTSPLRSDVAWPFPDRHDLSSLPTGSAFGVDDPEVIRFLFNGPVRTFWRVRQGDESFLLWLRRVAGWYEPEAIERQLEAALAPRL